MSSSDWKTDIGDDTPVTVIIKRRPKPDRIDEFEEIIKGTTRDAMSFKGHLGANIIRPTRPGDFYRIVFKFDSMDNYVAWEGSEIRRQWMQRYAKVEQHEQEIEILSGLETWFTLSGEETLVPPPKYKMLIVTSFSIFVLSIVLHILLDPVIGGFHLAIQIAVFSLIIATLMTYLVMPWMSRLLRRWLYNN